VSAPQPASHPLLDAVRPVADAVGAQIVDGCDLRAGDVPLEWQGRVVGGVRLPAAVPDLSWYVAAVERELGSALGDLDRRGRRRAVKLLDRRGAFRLRHSVEGVAGLLGVSRFTVYNDLNRPAGD
jgi:hypothetical protein